MSKYLNSQKKKLNRSQDDVDKEENAESGIRITSEDLTLRDISPSKQGTFTASQLHSSPGKRMTKTQRNITFADFDEKEGMPADVEQERGNNTAEPFSSPKGRQSSIDIISSLQSPNSQRKKFGKIYRPLFDISLFLWIISVRLCRDERVSQRTNN